MEKLTTNLANFEFEDSVLTITPTNDLLIDAKEMEAMVKEAVEFTKFTKYYVIINATDDYHLTADARNYYASCELSKYRYADAIVVNSFAIKILVNFYLQFNNPPVPTKMFNTIGEAEIWIQELKKKAKVH
jgi:hypothetical protein